MKRPIGSVSPTSSPTRSPPTSPARKRQAGSPGAARRSPARPDDLPSSSTRRPHDVERSPDLAAANVPRRADSVRLDQLPRDPFERIAGLLSSREHVDLARANPRTLGALVAPELKLARLERAAQAVGTRRAFDAVLGTPGDALDTTAETVRSLVGPPRARLLDALIRRVAELPDAQQAGALVESIQAVRELPIPLQEALVAPLMATADGAGITSTVWGDAWQGLRSLVEGRPAARRAKPLADLLRRLPRLPEGRQVEETNAGFAAIAGLAAPQRVVPLRSLLEVLGRPEMARGSHTLPTGLDAIAGLPIEDRARTIALLPDIVVHAAEPDDRQGRADSHRRDLVRAVREAIAALPAQARGEPLAALAKTIDALPEHERHLELQEMLHAAERLPDDEAAKAMKALFGRIRSLAPAMREAALRAGMAATASLTPDAQAVVLPKLLKLTDLMPNAQRVPWVRAGLARTQRMPAEQRARPLTALARTIALLPPAEQAPFIKLLATANGMLEREHVDRSFATLQREVAWLPAAGRDEGFHAIRDGIAGMPQALLAMTDEVHLWPSDGQPQRLRSLQRDLALLPAESRAIGLSRLASHIVSVSRNEARHVGTSLRIDIQRLPPALRRRPMDVLRERLGEGFW